MTDQHNKLPSSNSNNIVAQSDYEAALKAIDSTFEGFQPRPTENNDNSEQQLDQERIDEIYKACKESLLRNLDRIVQNVPDDDFHDYIDQYHYVMDDINDEVSPSKEELEMKMTIAETIEKGDDDSEEVDEEELLDEKALKNAQTLRSRIRDMSNTVQSVRARILQQSEEGVSNGFQPQLVDKPIEIVDSEKGEGEDAATALQDSLQTLSQILKDPQWSKLPHRIQSLQDTIDAIQKETAEDRTMSQTERAILSQNDDENQFSYVDASRKLLEESTDENEEAIVSAMDRLAMLGQCF